MFQNPINASRPGDGRVLRALPGFIALFLIVGLAGCRRVESDWKQAQQSNTVPAYTDFIAKHPEGLHVDEAKVAITKLQTESDWKQAQQSNTVPAYTDFIAKHPEGAHADEAEVAITKLIPQPAKPCEPDRSGPELAAWDQLDRMEPAALEKFIADFPTGLCVNDARFELFLHRKLDRSRREGTKTDFIIPFDQLGSRWQRWQVRSPEKGAVGVYRDNNAAGIFYAMGARSIQTDNSGVPILPTGDGSILVMDTTGLEYSYLDVVFQSHAGQQLYFGVVRGKGLVHLSGAGRVTLPNGATATFK